MQTRRGLPFLLLLTSLCWCVLAEDHHKRVPSGFTGVRGKKSIPEGAYDEQDAPEASKTLEEPHPEQQKVEKRAPSGFMGMRGKKPYSYGEPWEGSYQFQDAVYKRAPSGFMGMRGKKDNELFGYDEYPKRAPSGFMGMRGKKEYDPFEYYNEKRAPMGFVGMRGKKSYEDEFVEDKRAPQGFFGMRGKKLQRTSGFFGMRGKKYPYEFRGKFVGVRGKKDMTDADLYRNDYLARLGNVPNLDMNQLLLLLTEKNDEYEANQIDVADDENRIAEK